MHVRHRMCVASVSRVTSIAKSFLFCFVLENVAVIFHYIESFKILLSAKSNSLSILNCWLHKFLKFCKITLSLSNTSGTSYSISSLTSKNSHVINLPAPYFYATTRYPLGSYFYISFQLLRDNCKVVVDVPPKTCSPKGLWASDCLLIR